jgi:hypothetical protein
LHTVELHLVHLERATRARWRTRRGLPGLRGSSTECNSGQVDSFRNIGIALGVAALGALVPSRSLLNGGDPAHFVTGFHHALVASAVLAAAGAVASFALIRPRSEVSVELAAELAAAAAELAD